MPLKRGKIDMIRIELTNVRKRGSSGSEFREQSQATHGAYRADTIKGLCRELAEDGFDLSQAVEVYRDGTLCFTYATLDWWANGPVKGEQPEQLRK